MTTTKRSQDEMAKRVVGLVISGVLAGATLAGVPALALADQRQGDQSSGRAAAEQHMREMGTMMSDPELRESMTTMMSDMMSNSELRDEMVSMMSEAMGSMGGSMMGSMMGTGTEVEDPDQ